MCSRMIESDETPDERHVLANVGCLDPASHIHFEEKRNLFPEDFVKGSAEYIGQLTEEELTQLDEHHIRLTLTGKI